MRVRRLVTTALLSFLLLAPSTVYAYSTEEMVNLLTWRAVEQHADVRTVLSIAKCESTFNPFAISFDGSYGLGQWQAGQAAWRRTPAYQVLGIDIVKLYRTGDPDAPYFDADQLAWVFGPQAPRDLKYEWSCWYKI